MSFSFYFPKLSSEAYCFILAAGPDIGKTENLISAKLDKLDSVNNKNTVSKKSETSGESEKVCYC